MTDENTIIDVVYDVVSVHRDYNHLNIENVRRETGVVIGELLGELVKKYLIEKSLHSSGNEHFVVDPLEGGKTQYDDAGEEYIDTIRQEMMEDFELAYNTELYWRGDFDLMQNEEYIEEEYVAYQSKQFVKIYKDLKTHNVKIDELIKKAQIEFDKELDKIMKI